MGQSIDPLRTPAIVISPRLPTWSSYSGRRRGPMTTAVRVPPGTAGRREDRSSSQKAIRARCRGRQVRLRDERYLTRTYPRNSIIFVIFI